MEDIESENLILQVQKHACLYNMSLQAYRDRSLKRLAWLEIAKELNLDVDTCMKRWKCLKDRYRRNKHNVPKSGAAGGPRNEWSLGKMMQFIDPFCTSRKTSSNFAENEEQPIIIVDSVSDKPVLNSQELLAESATEQNLPQIEVLDWTQPDSSNPEKPTAKKLKKVAELHSSKRRSGSAQDDHSNMILKELRMANQIAEKEDDENELFFASMALKTKDLPPKKRSKLHMRILAEVHEALYYSDN